MTWPDSSVMKYPPAGQNATYVGGIVSRVRSAMVHLMSGQDHNPISHPMRYETANLGLLTACESALSVCAIRMAFAVLFVRKSSKVAKKGVDKPSRVSA